MVKAWLRHLMVDFDGVIYSYNKGFNAGLLTESPMPDAAESLQHLVDCGYEYTVFTSRMSLTDDPEGTKASILSWLLFWRFPPPRDVTCEKRPALVYLDDRARRFTTWRDVRTTYA